MNMSKSKSQKSCAGSDAGSNTVIMGWAIVASAVLEIIRMIPIIMATNGAQNNFPPSSIGGYVDLAQVGRTAWELSHLMLLTSLALFFMGCVGLYAELKHRGQNVLLGVAFIAMMGLATVLKVIAGVLDGFLLPAATNRSGLFAELREDLAHGFVGFSHEASMAFFGQGQTVLTTGIGLLSVALWRAEFLNKWVAAIGAGLSGLALLGLAIGVFGHYWQAFDATGPLIGLLGAWKVALGIAIIRHKPDGSTSPAKKIS